MKEMFNLFINFARVVNVEWVVRIASFFILGTRQPGQKRYWLELDVFGFNYRVRRIINKAIFPVFALRVSLVVTAFVNVEFFVYQF